jgi:hypothetical protein
MVINVGPSPSELPCTGAEQSNGNAADTVHISLLIWRWTTFCLQYSRIPSWNGLVEF